MRKILLALFIFYSTNSYSQIFSEITTESGIEHHFAQDRFMGGGVVFFDANNDGFDDIYLTSGFNEVKFYLNNQDGSFTDQTVESGLDQTKGFYTTGAISGDTDNDGDQDLFVTTWFLIDDKVQLTRNLFYENQGDGTFIERGDDAGIDIASFSIAATMLDYNLDGFLDIYVGNYVESGSVLVGDLVCFPNQLYRNNGDGSFTDVAPSIGIDGSGCTLAVKAADWNQNKEIDIYVANDFGGFDFASPNKLYNNTNGLFSQIAEEVNAQAEFYAMGIANGDYDMDGDFDMYVTNLGKNGLLRNDNGVFSREEDTAGVGNEFTLDESGDLSTTGWGTVFFDYDNNLWLDLFVANGRVPSDTPNPLTGELDPCKLYTNNEDGSFTDYTEEAGVGDNGRGRGMAMSDFDNDGDVDIFVVNQDANPQQAPGPYSSRFFRNDIDNNNNYLKITLEGVVNNRDGYGAIVKVHVGSHILLREHSTGGSHCSQHSSTMHFGLSDFTEVNQIDVIWPGGQVQTITPSDIDLSANQTIHIVEAIETVFEFDSFDASIEDSHIRLDWSGNSIVGNLGFEVQRSTDGVSFTTIDLVNPNTGNSYTYLDTETQSNVEYYYQIQQNSPSNQIVSNVETIIYFDESNFPVSVFPISNQLMVEWTSPSHSDIQLFELLRSTNSNSNFQLIESLAGGQNSYSIIDESASENQVYYYRLDVLINDHPVVDTDAEFGYLVADNNTSLQAIAGNQQITINWANVFEWEDCNFILQRKELNGIDYEIIQSIEANGSQSYSFTDLSANPLTSYVYQAVMIDGYGLEHVSNEDIASIIPVESFELTATAMNNSLVELNWNGNNEHNTSLILVERFDSNLNEFSTIEEINPTAGAIYSAMDEMVEPGNAYTYRIQQVDEYGGVLFSNEADVALEALDNSFIITPNPTSDGLTIQSTQLSNVESIAIIDSSGRVVLAIVNDGNSSSMTIDVSQLASGPYFLRTIGTSGLLNDLRFVKE